jgi:hypothetical protein
MSDEKLCPECGMEEVPRGIKYCDSFRTEFNHGRIAVTLTEQRDGLARKLAQLFGWEDKSFTHAVMHVENAVNNLRADLAVAHRRIAELERMLPDQTGALKEMERRHKHDRIYNEAWARAMQDGKSVKEAHEIAGEATYTKMKDNP